MRIVGLLLVLILIEWVVGILISFYRQHRFAAVVKR